MSHHDDRKEPSFSDSRVSVRQPGPAYHSLEPEPMPAMHPMAKLALLAVVLACLAFVTDRAYQRYQEYRLAQELQALADDFEQSMQNLANEEQARQEQIRRNRAATAEGRWLSKNCSDWRRSYQDNPQPTSRTEMRRHCNIYEKYLATGIAPR